MAVVPTVTVVYGEPESAPVRVALEGINSSLCHVCVGLIQGNASESAPATADPASDPMPNMESSGISLGSIASMNSDTFCF